MRFRARQFAVALLAVTIAGAGLTQQPAIANSDDAVTAAESHASTTKFGARQTLKVVSTLVDDDGARHVRLQRTYRGLDVVGGDLVVHQGTDGAWQGSSQSLVSNIAVGIAPKINQTVASLLAQVSTLAPSGLTSTLGAVELVVDATGATPRLAWRVSSHGRHQDGTPSSLTTYVDAATGQVLRAEEKVQTTTGSGRSLYAGTVPLNVLRSGSVYQLKDASRGNTYTADAGNKSDGALCGLLGSGCIKGTIFASTDTLFGNGTRTSRESAAVDAQYGSNKTWDFFKLAFGRKGVYGTGAGTYNLVHYGTNYVNAFWDGTKLTFGDGDGVNFGPLTSLDVTAHEMTHGITENTANLAYSGEPGALNESTSDIFGTVVEFYAANANDPGDYLIGEEFDLKKHRGFRRMDNPIADGSSPNCYSSNTKNLDVHYSSGVGNHFFYLLSEGTGAKTFGGVAHNSTACNGATLTGVGRFTAARIWYRALTVYFTSNTTFSAARKATLLAARDIYGGTSTQYKRVAAAWAAVRVS